MSPKLVLLCLAALVALTHSSPAPAPAGKLDSVNVDDVLKNKRLLENYVKCLMDKGPCSAEGAELKERLPKDLTSNCSACSDNERARIKKVVSFIKKEKPEVWDALKKKYDPDNKWVPNFESQ